MAVDSGNILVDAARVGRYRELIASVVGGRGDPGGGVVPPSFSSTWESAVALALFAEHELPFPRRGLLHVESELVALRPLREGQTVRCRVELERTEPHPRGSRLTLRCRNWTPGGQLCQENTLVVMVLGGGGGSVPRLERETRPDPVEWSTLAEWSLGADLGRRYAGVSGDYNPIHLWRWSSRLLGFERPILHGFCTEALLVQELSARLWNGDTTALRRLRVAFRAPLSLPARVLLLTADEPGGRGRFRIVDAVDGTRAYAEGEYVGGS